MDEIADFLTEDKMTYMYTIPCLFFFFLVRFLRLTQL